MFHCTIRSARPPASVPSGGLFPGRQSTWTSSPGRGSAGSWLPSSSRRRCSSARAFSGVGCPVEPIGVMQGALEVRGDTLLSWGCASCAEFPVWHVVSRPDATDASLCCTDAALCYTRKQLHGGAIALQCTPATRSNATWRLCPRLQLTRLAGAGQGSSVGAHHRRPPCRRAVPSTAGSSPCKTRPKQLQCFSGARLWRGAGVVQPWCWQTAAVLATPGAGTRADARRSEIVYRL